MSFPTNWAQTFLLLPGSYQAGGFPVVRGALMLWWLWDVPPDMSTWDWFAFRDDFFTWASGWLPNFAYDPAVGSAFSQAELDAYINIPPTYYRTTLIETGFWFANQQTLPLTHSYILQTFSDGFIPPKKGRKYLGSMLQSDVISNHLDPASWAYLQALVNPWVGGFTSQGTTFTPGIVSYKDKAFYPITRASISTRVGVLKRRGREKQYNDLWSSGIPWTPPH